MVYAAAGLLSHRAATTHWVSLASAERARQVRRGIQYDPAPPV
jgi:transcriptional regulator GlxA family with amidase domain